jgi:uncharacterized protein (TIGR03118 family)
MSSIVLRPSLAVGGLLLCLAALSSSFAHDRDRDHDRDRGERPRAYAVTPLVSDGAVSTPFTDPNLKNAWGVAFNPNGFVWVADNATGKSTLYDGRGMPQSLVVAVPGAGGQQGKPTGIVFSGSNDFVVAKNGLSGPSRFIFATENGTISGWAPNVELNNAQLAVDNSAEHSIYKGLALAATGEGDFLYATDFHNGRIDVFDASFHPVHRAGAFVDPKLPKGYAPFGIQNLQGDLYVTYARQDEEAEDDVTGAGFGVVDVFDAQGHLLRRIAAGGRLNAPWGLALAPADFGRFSNTLLVGNFGDGRISAFDVRSGDFLGQLRKPDGHRVEIEGLWGIAFGNGLQHQPTSTLFFAAGPNDEVNGVYGRIDPAAADEAKGEDDDD